MEQKFNRKNWIFIFYQKCLFSDGKWSSQPKYHILSWKTVTGSLKENILVLYKGKIEKCIYKKRKNQNCRNCFKKNAFLSHVQRITQPKDQVPRSKCVPCSPRTDRQTDGRTRKWKQRTPFQGFRIFSFNLSSRNGQTDRERQSEGGWERKRERGYTVITLLYTVWELWVKTENFVSVRWSRHDRQSGNYLTAILFPCCGEGHKVTTKPSTAF